MVTKKSSTSKTKYKTNSKKSTTNKKSQNYSLTEAIKKEAKKQAKNNPIVFVLVFVFLIGGAIGGYFISKKIVEKDCFILNGEKTISLLVGESFTYVEEGAKVIAFGKDISSNVSITYYKTDNKTVCEITDISTITEEDFFVVYRIDNIKYKNFQCVRTINVGVV